VKCVVQRLPRKIGIDVLTGTRVTDVTAEGLLEKSL